MKQRQKDILRTLAELGGRATTRQIAVKLGLHVNGVAQSLGALFEHVRAIDRQKGGDRIWELIVIESSPPSRPQGFL